MEKPLIWRYTNWVAPVLWRRGYRPHACLSVWETKQRPVILPKKGDTLKYANNRTIALISHASKVILKIIAGMMKNRLDADITDEQAGFTSGRGTRDQIHNMKMIMLKRRGRLYIFVINYQQGLWYGESWEIMARFIWHGFSKPHCRITPKPLQPNNGQLSELAMVYQIGSQ